MAEWRFEFRPQPTMPPLAWVAAVRDGVVRVDCGASVRTFEQGFVEGTWVGPADPALLPESTTVFGTGMVAHGGELLAVPPSHHLECIYFGRVAEALVVSNSLVGLLVATGLKLDRDANYSEAFLESVQGCWLIDDRVPGGLQLRHQHALIPTTTVPITAWRVENLLINPDLSIAQRRRPREQPWRSFAEFKERLTAAAKSVVANDPRHEPVVALSGGYDSTGVGVFVVQAGGKRAAGFKTARPGRSAPDVADSGERIAASLGLDYTGVERLSYLERTDLAEADFVASGMAAEDIVFLGLEQEFQHRMAFNGWWAGTEWAEPTRDSWQDVLPITTSGSDFTEYRLRADFVWVPLLVFGAIRTLDAPSLLDRPEMDPYRIGGTYDRPVARRVIEEAGLARGTFATHKRAVSALPPRDGLATFSEAAQDSITRFAQDSGSSAKWRPRRPFSGYERALLRWAERLRIAPLAKSLKHRQARLTHFEPRFGNLLLRWSLSVIEPRYAAVRSLLNDGQ